MSLIVMCLENIDQYIWRNDLIGIVVHDLEYLTYGSWRKPHMKTNVVEGAHFLFMLFLVNVHQEQQPVELNYTLGLGFKDDFRGFLTQKMVKDLFFNTKVRCNLEQKLVFRFLQSMIHPCKGNHLRKNTKFLLVGTHGRSLFNRFL